MYRSVVYIVSLSVCHSTVLVNKRVHYRVRTLCVGPTLEVIKNVRKVGGL